jgi:signal transduction histidine kinase
MDAAQSEQGLASDRLERLIEVGRTLLSELDLDAVLDRVLDTACELTGARYAALGILDERRRELAQFLTRGVDPETHAAIGELPRGRGILGLLISEPRPLRLEDVNTHPQSYGFPPAHPPMKTFLGVPIQIRGEAWGNIYLTEKAGDEPFSAEDERAGIVLADWAAIAIDNARLYQRAEGRRAELERAVRGFEATAAIAQAVGGESDLSRVLELIVKRGRALVEARSVVILLREGDELVVAATAGQTAYGAPDRKVPVSGSTAGDVLQARVSRRVTDAASELGATLDRLGVPDAQSGLLVPLVYRGRALGVLAAFDRLTGDVAFTGDDQHVLQAFAASAATAVATTRTVEADRLERSLRGAEHERGRWARELHDQTLQGLATLKMLVGRMQKLDDPDAVRATVADLGEQITNEIANLRGIIADLRPPVLDEVGLKPALETLAERTSAAHGIEVRSAFALSDDERLPSDLETTIYRLVQESLTNAVKHADARAVDIGVRASEDGRIVVRVADDGRGFDPDSATEGFGLSGMRERVELAGGTVTIQPGDLGTVVQAVLPRTR